MESYGGDTGHNTLYLTPGLLIGRIPIHDRVALTFGAGYQVAVTYHQKYNQNVILTARIPFQKSGFEFVRREPLSFLEFRNRLTRHISSWQLARSEVPR